MSAPNVYELAAQYRGLLYADTEEDLAELLDALEGDIEERVDALAAVVRTLEAQEKLVKTEVARMQDRARSLGNRAKRVRQRMLEALQLTGIRKVKSHRFTVSRSKGRRRVFVFEPEHVPAWAVTERVVRDVDVKAIERAIKAAEQDGELREGVEMAEDGAVRVTGAHVEQGNETLTIR